MLIGAFKVEKTFVLKNICTLLLSTALISCVIALKSLIFQKIGNNLAGSDCWIDCTEYPQRSMCVTFEYLQSLFLIFFL